MAQGVTGAQVEDWVRRARERARAEARALLPGDLVAVVSPPDTRSPDALWEAAVHEAGHAVAFVALGVGHVDGVSLIRSDGSGGHVSGRWLVDGSLSRDRVEQLVSTMLAGRAAEEAILGEPRSGSGGSRTSDLAVATRMIAGLHVSLGLGGSLVHRAPPDEVERVLAFDPHLRERVAEDLDRIYARTLVLVRENEGAILALAQRAVVERVVTGTDAEALIRAHLGRPKPGGQTRRAPHG